MSHHLAAPPFRPRETDAEPRARRLDLTRELTDLNMIAVRDAAHRIATRDPPPINVDPAATRVAHPRKLSSHVYPN
jgi:hypothetical protein